jgi:hypothetical protein
VRILVDVRVVKIHLTIFHAGKSITNLPFARAQRLDFGPVQNHPRLDRLEDVVITTGLRIGEYI